jgi:ABC-type sulfate/molybdate transport systems ATPase subunit
VLDVRIVRRRAAFTVDVALRVETGAALGLFGASGAGKSTVLSCLAGLETPDDGFARLDGLTLFPPSSPLHRRPIGYLTQDASLFPHLTVAQNVRFAVDGERGGARRREAWLDELRDRLRLNAIWDTGATRISGGQARRVAMARMLARRPKLVLLDEPFTGLDRHLVRSLLDDLVAWRAALGFTLLVVDHQPAILERLADRVAVIEDGRLVQTATWDELRAAPATELLRDLLAPL